MVLTMEELSIEEREIFDELMDRVKEFISDEFILYESDAFLHFLIRNKFNVDKAVDMIRDAWETIWDLTDKAKAAEKIEVFECRKYLPYGQCGIAKNGAFVWWIRTGCIDVTGIWKSSGREGVFNFVFQEWEIIFNTIKEKCQNLGQKRYNSILIFDLEGFPIWALSKLEYIKFAYDLRNQFSRFLPLTVLPCLDAIYAINAGKIYTPVIEFAKYFAPYDCVWEKVHIFGKKRSDWLPTLLEKIDESQIPPFYGGSRKGDDEFCSNEICPGGKVPKELYLKK